MKFKFLLPALCAALLFSACKTTSFSVSEGAQFDYKEELTNFVMYANVQCSSTAEATIGIHTEDESTGKGYRVVLHNGPLDGSVKTGSLRNIRNLYKTTMKNDRWFPMKISVRGKNITVEVDGVEVVNYTEPENPYRTEKLARQRFGSGTFIVRGHKGSIQFSEFRIEELAADAVNPDALPAVDEQNDRIIKLQQEGFPVIDYHVHLKGWGKDDAHRVSMNYGINYGIAPNCGIGFPITTDEQVAAYCDSVQNMPFYFGMQGEGREWPQTFSKASRDRFDYVFTDALTFTDHKGRRTRLWIDEEVFIDIPQERYMDQIVDNIVKVISEEPIDIYVNPCFLPSAMEKDYDKLWTKPRIDRVVKALVDNNVALEINARYNIPNFAIIKAAKQAGIRFAFGTNNGDANIGKLEYCMEAMDACGLQSHDIWFPTMRANR